MDDLTAIWDWLTAHQWVLWTAGGTVTAVLAVLLIARLFGAIKGTSLGARAEIGFFIVQAAFAFVLITGTYEFWTDRAGMHAFEATACAVIIEAATWYAVGMIYEHAGGFHYGPRGRQHANTGAGAGAWVFAVAAGGGGILAVLGSSTFATGLGRAVVVVIGASLWVLRILRKINRSTVPSRFRYSPRRILMDAGWLIVGDDDVTEDAESWQVRQLVRAMRRAGSKRWPARWLGSRALLRREASATADVWAEALRRRAVGQVIQAESKPDSPTMRAAVADARTALLGGRVMEAPPVEPPGALGDGVSIVATPDGVKVGPFLDGDELAAARNRAAGLGWDEALKRELTAARPDEVVDVPSPPVDPVAESRPRARPSSNASIHRRMNAMPPAGSNEATEQWLAGEYEAGRAPSLSQIRKHGAVDGKDRSENWAVARKRAVQPRGVPAA